MKEKGMNECWNCKQLTDAFLAVNPERKGVAKCDECVKKMLEQGFVFIDLPHQPQSNKQEEIWGFVEIDKRFIL